MFQLLGGHFPLGFDSWLNEAEFIEYNNIRGGFEKTQFIEKIIENKILRGSLLDLSSLPPFIDNGLIKIIKKATHKDYKKRYSTCVEFQMALFNYNKNKVDWIKNGDTISAKKPDGTECKISPDKAGFKLDIRKGNKDWRKDNKHTGTLESIINRIQA